MDKAFLDLMEDVEAKREEIRCSRSGAFFRGHSSSNYRLIPSLLRTANAPDAEHNLYHECFARANHLLPRDATSWERLAFFQHHGIPTRLLDWTESLGVALFFAVAYNPDQPHIWIVNAFRLNKASAYSDKGRIFLAGLDAIPDYHDCFVRFHNRVEWPNPLPMFLQIPWTSSRIRAQSGFFTFHAGTDCMEDTCSKYLRRVDIPKDAIPGTLRFLELAGITEHTVFPDFVGLAGYLKSRYRL